MGLGPATLKGVDLGIHVGQELCYCLLLIHIAWQTYLELRQLLLADLQKSAATTQLNQTSLLRHHEVKEELAVHARGDEVLESLIRSQRKGVDGALTDRRSRRHNH